jgi:hypothetical protein
LARLRCAVPGSRNDDDISDLLLCAVLPLHALHNQTAIDGSFKTVMPDGLIGGALIESYVAPENRTSIRATALVNA